MTRLIALALCVVATTAAFAGPGDLTAGRAKHRSLNSAVQQPSMPAVAGDVLNQVAGVAGGAPLGITVTDTDIVIVNDLFNGTAQTYTLDLVMDLPLANPATQTATGVAFNPNTSTLWWIDADAGTAVNNFLVETDLAGVVLNTFGLSPSPGATQTLPAGIAYSSATNTIWVNDILNDIYYQVNLDGSLAGGQFLNPDDVPPGTGAFGNGISHVFTGTYFDLPAGTIGEGQVSRMYRIDSVATVFDQASLLSTGDTFINGNVWHPTGSTGVEVNYVVGNASNTIFEVEMTLSGTPCSYAQISGLNCDQVGPDVVLNWQNNAAYDEIQVFRGGTQIATLGGGATTYTDLAPAGGTTMYSLLTLLGGEPCGGGVCTVQILGAGQAIAAYPGGAAFGITVIEADDTVAVTDLNDGNLYLFDRNLNPTGTILLPGFVAGDTVTGVTWEPGTNTIYFINSTQGTLYQMDSTGLQLGTFPIASPAGGALGGMTMNCAGNGFIIDDIANDIYFETDLTGAPTGLTFNNPANFPVGTGAFGNGITVNAAGDGYDVPVGTLAAGQVDQITRIDCMGNQVGCAEAVGAGTFIADDFVNGVANTSEGPGGLIGEYRYVVGNASDRIFANEVICDPCPPVTGLACDSSGADVTLDWTAPTSSVNSFDILRDGILVDNIPGTSTTYTDAGVPDGIYTYTVRSNCTSGSFDAVCAVNVANVPAGTTDLVWAPELATGFGASGQAMLAELLDAGRNAYLVVFLEGIDLSNIETIWGHNGIFPDNHVITADEGIILRDFALAGGNLYVSGGDIWGFDAPTALQEVDATVGLEDGAELCDVPSVTGFDSGLAGGVDLSVAGTGIYTGECAYIDHLAINVPDGAAVVQVSDGPVAQAVSIYHDGTISTLGDFRTITTSIEYFGQADVSALLAEYLGAFYGGTGQPEFIRGNANGDAVFDISDAVFLLAALFTPGAPPPGCRDAADANDDGLSDISDAVFMLAALFTPGAAPIPAPGSMTCGPDPTMDALDCAVPCP